MMDINTLWQTRVRQMLAAGFGAEDIALTTRKTSTDVRREIQILRDSGELPGIYAKQRYGPTAQRLMTRSEPLTQKQLSGQGRSVTKRTGGEPCEGSTRP